MGSREIMGSLKSGDREEFSAIDLTEDMVFNHWLLINNRTSENATETAKLREYFRKAFYGSSDLSGYPGQYWKNGIIIIFYSIIIIVSLFGNLLVCKVILSRFALRRRTTNILILNLCFSDLLMTVFAIPLTVARLILDEWPLGSTLCSLAPFIQVTSIYVSALTMTVIALDRYQVLVNPMRTRLCSKAPKYVVIGLIWMIAGVLSIPHSIFNRQKEMLSDRPIFRCATVYPKHKLFYRRLFTIITTSTQYLIPLSITLLTYGLIALKIYRKANVGEMTQQQLHQRLNTKYKTIKMLMTVVIIFAVCWLPINLFHIINDFFYFDKPPVGFNTFLVCHWLAFSSVCWNPFIYFGLNPYYRQGLRKIFLFTKSAKSNNSLAMNTRSSALLSQNNSKISERKLSASLSLGKNNMKNCVNTSNNLVNEAKNGHKNKCFVDDKYIKFFPKDQDKSGRSSYENFMKF